MIETVTKAVIHVRFEDKVFLGCDIGLLVSVVSKG
jgi:hypothetical protein